MSAKHFDDLKTANGVDRESIVLFADVLAQSLGAEQFFEVMARALHHCFGMDRASLTVYDETTDQFQLVALALDKKSRIGPGSYLPRDGSRVGRAFDACAPQVSGDLITGHAFLEDDLLAKEGMRCGLTLPLMVDASGIGTLNFNWREQVSLSSNDLRILERVASVVARTMRQVDWLELIRPESEDDNLCHRAELLVLKRPSIGADLVRLKKFAASNASILIGGETGSGKGVLAKAFHTWSERRDAPFVKCDCASLSPSLIESELFGHERGAFTGATSRRIGRFELADAGSLFLDEIGEVPMDVQPKLLGAIEEREFLRVGGMNSVRTDIRVISATNRDLDTRIEEGEFRRDLFHRLCVLEYELPPLRDCPADTRILADHFVKDIAARSGRSAPRLTADSYTVLNDYHWPGNVRELANVIERAMVLNEESALSIDKDLLSTKSIKSPVSTGGKTLGAVEKAHIERTLDDCDGRISGKMSASEVLGLHPNTLRSKMKALGISRTSASYN
jgi:formate hydrogenlyase transcriptional activator